MARTLYQVIGAHPRASEVELLAAWQRLADPLEREAKISGPAAERLNELNAAWAVLGNPEARAAYDATLPDSAFDTPSLDEVMPEQDAAVGRPLFDWRVGRLLVLITVLSLLVIGWRSCSFSWSSDRARAQAEANEAEARARDAENRARIETQMDRSASGLPAGEERWQREQDARANEEARRESDEQIAAREAAREREAAEAAEMRARAEAEREQAEAEAAERAAENRERLEREKAMLERLQDDNNRAMRLR